MFFSLIALNLHKFSFVSRQKKDDSRRKESFVRSTISIFIIAKRFLKVAQQLLNCQSSLFGAASEAMNNEQ